MVCLVLKFEPKMERFNHQVALKIFKKEAVSELCSTSSYYDMSSQLEEMRLVDFGGKRLSAKFEGYILDKDRLVAKVAIMSWG
jgi:hypothetical protein